MALNAGLRISDVGQDQGKTDVRLVVCTAISNCIIHWGYCSIVITV